jgi:hypothetical protein
MRTSGGGFQDCDVSKETGRKRAGRGTGSVGFLNSIRFTLLYATSWTTGVRYPADAVHSAQTGSGAHPASYPIGTRGSFPEGKVAGA